MCKTASRWSSSNASRSLGAGHLLGFEQGHVQIAAVGPPGGDLESDGGDEAKEHWFLERHPKRTEAAVRVHAYFVFFCMALVEAFRAYEAACEEAAMRGEDTGIDRYRRKLERQNRDKVVVFAVGHFDIFRSFEFALLADVQVRERALMGENAQSVLQRYGIVTSDSS